MNRTNLVLVIAILCLASFYSWSKLHKVEETNQKFESSRYYPGVEEEGVESIRITSKDPAYDYTLHRKADHWYIDSNLLNIEKTHQLVHTVLELTRERQMEANPSQAREKEFKLDQPSYRFEPFKNGGESLGAVKLGARTPDYNQYYGQMEKGGSVDTVPAFTFSVLEEKPKDLIEASLFPVEVAAVDTFSAEPAGGTKVSLKRQGESDLYSFVTPKAGKADESAVKDFLFKLHDLKIARFLAAEEHPEMGDRQVRYEAKLSYSDYLVVTELYGRVAANPKLLYGRRYFVKTGEDKPAAGTEERFVVEIPQKSEVLQPSDKLFVDRRVAVFDLNKVEELHLSGDLGKQDIVAGKHGKWLDSSHHQVPQDRMNGLLWTLRDLRFETETKPEQVESKPSLEIKLTGDGFQDIELRFGVGKNGNPYLRRGAKAYDLSQTSWNALTDSVKKFLKTKSSGESQSEQSDH